ncbi:DoxX family protein [Chitinophaga vietnamensis]|uniref:DoxX family protein n=1 Tax=Chitinophaga vietnamensis TaxID=2593957 RepID=UPI001F2D7E68|nr:DoxX family protein [Chitinophaga vietnamensis]
MYKSFMQRIFSTDSNWTGFVLRLTLGLVLFPHATQKMFGWFGGPGISGEMHYMTAIMKLPAFVAASAIFVECAGMILLIAGAGTRIAAFSLFWLFIGMIAVEHGQNGFFVNWFGVMPAGKEGFEYHLLVLGICIALLIQGGGRYAVDGTRRLSYSGL